jgi:hypothetical protein
MKYDMDNGCWWGLITNGVLRQVTWSRNQPHIFDFQCSFTISSDVDNEIIPVKIIPETY